MMMIHIGTDTPSSHGNVRQIENKRICAMMGMLISRRQTISSPSIKITISSKNLNVKREYLRFVVHHSLWAVMTQSQTKKVPNYVVTIDIIKHRSLSLYLCLPAIVCRPPFLTENKYWTTHNS